MESNWQTIDKAPLDGSIIDILVWHKYYNTLMRITDCWWTGQEWATSSLMSRYLLVDSYTEPRYFFKLPDQPKE